MRMRILVLAGVLAAAACDGPNTPDVTLHAGAYVLTITTPNVPPAADPGGGCGQTLSASNQTNVTLTAEGAGFRGRGTVTADGTVNFLISVNAAGTVNATIEGNAVHRPTIGTVSQQYVKLDAGAQLTGTMSPNGSASGTIGGNAAFVFVSPTVSTIGPCTPGTAKWTLR